MRLILTGSRSFTDLYQLSDIVDHYCSNINVTEYLFGGSEKTLGIYETYMISTGLKIRDYHHIPQYFDRMVKMAKDTDFAIIVWDGVSDGTKIFIDILKRFKVPTKVVKI